MEYEYYSKGLEVQDADPTEALNLFNKALALNPEYAEALAAAGHVSGFIQNRFDSGLVFLEKADRFMKKRNQIETADYAKMKRQIGAVYEVKGDLDRALEYYGESLDIHGRLGLQNTANNAMALEHMAVINEKKGQKERAGKLFRKAYDAYQSAGYAGEAKEAALKNAKRLGY